MGNPVSDATEGKLETTHLRSLFGEMRDATQKARRQTINLDQAYFYRGLCKKTENTQNITFNGKLKESNVYTKTIMIWINYTMGTSVGEIYFPLSLDLVGTEHEVKSLGIIFLAYNTVCLSACRYLPGLLTIVDLVDYTFVCLS